MSTSVRVSHRISAHMLFRSERRQKQNASCKAPRTPCARNDEMKLLQLQGVARREVENTWNHRYCFRYCYTPVIRGRWLTKNCYALEIDLSDDFGVQRDMSAFAATLQRFSFALTSSETTEIYGAFRFLVSNRVLTFSEQEWHDGVC